MAIAKDTLRTVLAAAATLAASFAGTALLAEDPAPPQPFALDEGFTMRFARSFSAERIGYGVFVRTPSGPGFAAPRGRFETGRPLIDPKNGRSVVVRPEAVREYFQLIASLAREDAQVEAERVLARVEKTGNLGPLDSIDIAMQLQFGASAGSRLDDPATTAFYPAYSSDPTTGLRRLVAGDDALWHGYLVDGDLGAFSQLQANSSFERFYHPVDQETGLQSPSSVLRLRAHRRVLFRRTRTYATFLPDLPMRPDMADTAMTLATDYTIRMDKTIARALRSLTSERGERMPLSRFGSGFTTAPDTGEGGTFLGGVTSPGIGTGDPPRVVNVTPPAGETFIDRTTDWEDPDNQFTVPIPARRLFVVRIRFSRPLDPRTVDAAHVKLTKIATLDSFGNATPVNVPTAASVFLAQRRTGEILVEVTPNVNLDPQSIYEVRVLGTVKSLDGTEMGTDFVAPL